MMQNDNRLSIEDTLGIWSELLDARRGKNGYGGTVAEIYAYRVAGIYDATGAREVDADVAGGGIYAARAAANLTAILRQFQEAYPSCKIGVEVGRREFRTLDLATEAIEPFDHRVHIEVLDPAAKSTGPDEIRRELSEAPAGSRADTRADTTARLSVEATLLLVEAVDRLTDAVDEHGGKIAAALDHITNHLPGDR